MSYERDLAVWQAVRDWGRRGVPEGTIASLARTRCPGMTVRDCLQTVDRLLATGSLYRHRRRSRTLIQAGTRPQHPDSDVGSTHEQPGLWG